MRPRLAAIAFATALTMTAACTSTGRSVTPQSKPAAPTASTPDNSSAVCDDVFAFAMARGDKSDTRVADFLDVIANPDKYPPERRIAIRHTYYTQQVTAIRPLVAKATTPQLHNALQNYADGWAELAADRTAAGPRNTQPDWRPVMDLCPGTEERIIAAFDAQNK